MEKEYTTIPPATAIQQFILSEDLKLRSISLGMRWRALNAAAADDDVTPVVQLLRGGMPPHYFIQRFYFPLNIHTLTHSNLIHFHFQTQSTSIQ